MTHREKKKEENASQQCVCVEMPGLLENKMPSSRSRFESLNERATITGVTREPTKPF